MDLGVGLVMPFRSATTGTFLGTVRYAARELLFVRATILVSMFTDLEQLIAECETSKFYE